MSWLGLVVCIFVAWVVADGLGSAGLGLAIVAVMVGVHLGRLHRRIAALEKALAQAETQAPVARPELPREADAPAADRAAPLRDVPEQPPTPSMPPARTATPATVAEAGFEDWADTSAGASEAAAPQPAAPAPAMHRKAGTVEVDEHSARVTSSLGRTLMAWFRGGNTIVRVAVLILFLGVAFLLRYAAEHAMLPIEFRLAAVAAGGLGLVAFGWRVRHARRGYGLTLQGAGIGVLYLTVFAAFRLYGLLPAGLAFVLLAGLSGATALLAVAQVALPLAVVGFGGGFLAPVFASTGQGSHVALFSYYLVLNLAIAWIASRQSWKLLNLVGFLFTFSIGSAWGLRAYQPELFASTEPFLVAHFLLYLFISVQYSRGLVQARAEPGTPALPYVDAGLLFGVPIVAFGLQASLVKDMPYALALSSAVMSGIYLLLGRWLWRQGGQQMRLLTEGLLALGVIFLALVTPLALDARWTGAAWAIQGAGIVWVGLRQRRAWATVMGLLLQVGAALAFWDNYRREPDTALFANGLFLGVVALALSAWASAWLLHRQARHAPATSPQTHELGSRPVLLAAHWGMLGLSLAQGLVGVWDEWRLVPAASLDEPWRLALLLALLAAKLELLQPRLRWPELSLPARGALLAAAAVSAGGVLDHLTSPTALWTRLTHGWGWLECAAVLGLGAWLQTRLRGDGWRRPLAAEGLVLAWYAMLQAATALYGLAGHAIARHEAWTPLAAIVGPTLLAWLLAARAEAGHRPVGADASAWRYGLFLPWLAILLLWTLFTNALSDGSMAPLPYLPMVNPIDLGHVLIALYALRLSRSLSHTGPPLARAWAMAGAAAAFWWLNALLIRSLHHWAGTPMWEHGALASGLVQTGLTILWTVLALLAMLVATRKAPPAHARSVWLVGAGLLGAVVLKLFFVDLSSIGTLERIVSFLGVGVLMLVIGYVSPLPPAAAGGDRSASGRDAASESSP